MDLFSKARTQAAAPSPGFVRPATAAIAVVLGALLALVAPDLLPVSAFGGDGGRIRSPAVVSVLVEYDVVVAEEPDAGAAWQEARLVPLRGAPAWVWQLSDDDPRKIAAIEDWTVTAAVDRELGMVVMEWTGRILSDAEYWNGLSPRWVADPEWGSVQP